MSQQLKIQYYASPPRPFRADIAFCVGAFCSWLIGVIVAVFGFLQVVTFAAMLPGFALMGIGIACGAAGVRGSKLVRAFSILGILLNISSMVLLRFLYNALLKMLDDIAHVH